MINILTLVLTFAQSQAFQDAISKEGTWIVRIGAILSALIAFALYNAGRVAVKTQS